MRESQPRPLCSIPTSVDHKNGLHLKRVKKVDDAYPAGSGGGSRLTVALHLLSQTLGSMGDMRDRPRGFPPEVGVPFDIHRLTSSGDSGYASTLELGPQGDIRANRLRSFFKERAVGLDALSLEFHELVTRHDAVQLIMSIAAPVSMRLVGDDVLKDARLTHSWDAKVEYLAGVALTGPPGSEAVNEEVARRARDLVAAVFEAAQAHLVVQSMAENGADRLDSTRRAFSSGPSTSLTAWPDTVYILRRLPTRFSNRTVLCILRSLDSAQLTRSD